MSNVIFNKLNGSIIISMALICLSLNYSCYCEGYNKFDSTAKITSNKEYSLSPLFGQVLTLYKTALEAYVKGDYPTAIVTAQKALCLDPLEEECFLLLKQAKTKIGIVEKDGGLKDSSALSKNDQQNIFFSGMQSYLQKDFANAKRRWEFLQAINDTFPELKQYLSRVIRETNTADSLNKLNTNAIRYFKTALKFYGDGNKKSALNYLDTSLQVYPGQIESITLKNRINMELQVEYQRVLDYGKAMYNSGAYKKAIDIWQSGLLFTKDNSTLITLIKEAQEQVVEIKKLFIQEAQNCIENNDFPCALEKYKKAFNLTPEDTSLVKKIQLIQSKGDAERNRLYQLALEKGSKEEFFTAADILSELLRFAPDYRPAKEYLDMCNAKIIKQAVEKKIQNHRKNAQDAEKQENLNEALYCWNQVLTNDSAANDADSAFQRLTNRIEQKQKIISSDNMYAKSMELFKNGKYQEARDLWNLILVKDPDNAHIKQMLQDIERKKHSILTIGDTLLAKKEYGLAIKQYNDAKRINPANNAIQQKIVQTQKKYDDEEFENKKIGDEPVKKSSDPKKVNDLFNKGLEFYMAQQFDNALENWTKILSIDPQNSRAQSYVKNLENKIKKLNQL